MTWRDIFPRRKCYDAPADWERWVDAGSGTAFFAASSAALALWTSRNRRSAQYEEITEYVAPVEQHARKRGQSVIKYTNVLGLVILELKTPRRVGYGSLRKGSDDVVCHDSSVLKA